MKSLNINLSIYSQSHIKEEKNKEMYINLQKRVSEEIEVQNNKNNNKF